MWGDFRTKEEDSCAGDRRHRKPICGHDLKLLLDTGSVPSLISCLPDCKSKRHNCSHSAPVRPVPDDLPARCGRISPIRGTPSPSVYTSKLNPDSKDLFPSTEICASILSPIVSGACALGSAFYASHPPAEPLLLVPISIAASPWNPTQLTSIDGLGLRVVRAVLCDLLANLTLRDQVKSVSASQTGLAQARSSPDPSVNADTSDSARCSVATQAHALQSVWSDSACSNAALPTGPTNNWRGGVRALRDSHVRLVLKQLRHVERLNRALDSTSTLTRRPTLSNTRTNRLAANKLNLH